ncbi:alpha-N-acetylglucosaminidase [Umezawaea tangerina]|uniref:Alpha-N-acetylglucosaminidase n=1 Tax=Umezawaea tangerina TaxID=84725 RepID=A0A2T0TE95_9PSEU|nr:alpha-N-acetylglucosaminidase [Umezawaea tangerina]PRY43989.1 alpha-N-acetylglucosaminidase [Umezawaea tangerina]
MQRRALAGAVVLVLLAALVVTDVRTTGKAFVDVSSAKSAITRLLGGDSARAAQIEVRTTPASAGTADSFRVGGTAGHVQLSGTSQVAIVSGFNWWLKYVAGGHLSTNGDRLDLPQTLPAPEKPISKRTTLSDRYAYNFTVYGYTMPYWTWTEWEREIDYLAASGVNRALVLVGQEAVWYDTFQSFGMSESQVRDWIAQPSFQPWQWYGSTTGYDPSGGVHAGPVSADLIKRRAELGRRVADRMRELGITPVFPAFEGHVPDQVFADANPGANVIPQGGYSGHPRPFWLAPTDPLYAKVAAKFYEVQSKRFGDTTHYSNDLMHEGGELGGVDLGEAGKAVQDALTRAHPDSTWVLQAWQGNPEKDLIDAIDRKRVLVLDLDADDGPSWEKTDAFWGAPWAWGTIQNFGGRLGVFGNLTEPGQTLPEIRAKSTGERGNLVGTAMVLEGTHLNPVVQDLFGEMVWRDKAVDLDSWILDYAKRRYGAGDDPHVAEAWEVLLNTAYSFRATGHQSGEGPYESPFAALPALKVTSASYFGPPEPRYSAQDFEPVLGELLQADAAVREEETYKYDLVDVTRQILANRGRSTLQEIARAYAAKDVAALDTLTDRFLGYMKSTDELLGTQRDWLLGTWLESAKAWGKTPEEKAALERDARGIISIWSEKACDTLRDYANREWQGMVSSYYQPRWERFFAELAGTVESGVPPTIDWCANGVQWTSQTTEFPTEPTGDTYEVAKRIAQELGLEN